MFHVYVDPLFGDDALAWQQNPGSQVPTNPEPLDPHPFDTGRVKGNLQHAPYSFRTLTGVQGAMRYVNRTGNFPPTTSEWTFNDPTYSVQWVVIHCLPGMYGPKTKIENGQPVLQELDSESGLPFNGEVFPVELRQGVSLQGASALDTIFDARRHETCVIEARGTQQGVNWRNSFIDGLTIRGTRSDGMGQPDPPSQGRRNCTGAGVFLGGYSNNAMTISNCFITDNVVGIVLDTNRNPEIAPVYTNRPRIINNTIAWNRVGIWSGNLWAGLDNHGTAQGHSLPVLLNNVIDSGIPVTTPAYTDLTRLSCFEGVSAEDLVVETRTAGGAKVPVDVAFNAWESGFANTGMSASANFPTTTPRTATPLPPPVVDLSPYTNVATGAPRGTLYINDMFRNSGVGSGNPVRGLSAHDFRLLPNVSDSATIAPGDQSPRVLNPLVNAGMYLSSALTELAMANGETVTLAPGLETPDDPQSPAAFHAWDWDADGYANRRVHLRSGGFPTPPEWNHIDLGADEMDELIVGGFIEGTRIFSTEVPWPDTIPPPPLGPPMFTPHDRIYFFDVVGVTGKPRPDTNLLVGDEYEWWPHVLIPSDISVMQPNSNYTDGFPGSFRHDRTTQMQRPPCMRNLNCDVSPHVVQEDHPFASLQFNALEPVDIYAANPSYMAAVGWAVYDNCFAYHNPSTSGASHQTYLQLQFGYPVSSVVVDGTINPSGTTYLGSPWSGTATHLRLHPAFPVFQFGPYGSCSGNTVAFGKWCYNDTPSGCPDQLPYFAGFDFHGLRWNCAYHGPSLTNIQTFLTISGGTSMAFGEPLQGPPVDPSTDLDRIAVPDGLRRAMRQWRDWRAERRTR